MKRPQTQAPAEIEPTSMATVDDDLDSIKSAYKRAKKAYKNDKSNEDLKRAKSKAKKALEEAEANINININVDATVSASETEADNATATPALPETEINVNVNLGEDASGVSVKVKVDQGTDTNDTDVRTPSGNIKHLEEAYQKSLSAFKANKSDKDLRRAKTAARRALDDAILAASSKNGGKQLVCADCSKKFIFSKKDQEKYEKNGWKDSLPKRCKTCKEARAGRLADRGDDRTKLDGKKKNMCYAFQRGECPHGANCKFSHNPEHGGKRSNDDDNDNDNDNDKEGQDGDDADGTGTGNSDNKKKNDNPEEGMKESKERKEQSLRKKGKGWRNK